MDEEIKILARKTADKIYRKVKRLKSSEFYKFGINIGIGADGTLTKYIDKIAEDVAVNFIRKSDIKVNILTEEAGFLDFGGKYTFVLDPVDGTRNACRGISFYSVSLGVGKLRLDDIDFGIVRNIPTGDIYVAEKGHGAFLNNKRINTPELPAKEIISSLILEKNLNKDILTFSKMGKIRSLGSASLEMCMIANGALDFYVVGNEYLRVTDIAASTLIVREAGGIVTNIYGEKLDMPLNLDDRTSVIASCNNDLINKIIS